MNKGEGVYDEVCTLVRQTTEGDLIAVIVVNGNNGSGFSVQTTDEAYMSRLPDMLEFMAAEIRKGAS